MCDNNAKIFEYTLYGTSVSICFHWLGVIVVVRVLYWGLWGYKQLYIKPQGIVVPREVWVGKFVGDEKTICQVKCKGQGTDSAISDVLVTSGTAIYLPTMISFPWKKLCIRRWSMITCSGNGCNSTYLWEFVLSSTSTSEYLLLFLL